jgi:hypothetical protein
VPVNDTERNRGNFYLTWYRHHTWRNDPFPPPTQRCVKSQSSFHPRVGTPLGWGAGNEVRSRARGTKQQTLDSDLTRAAQTAWLDDLDATNRLWDARPKRTYRQADINHTGRMRAAFAVAARWSRR